MNKIVLPKELTTVNSLEFIKFVSLIREEGPFEIDFSPVKWVEPFGLLIIGGALFDFIESHPGSKLINFEESTGASYAGHIGFFKSFGIDFGNVPGYQGNINYIPIQFMDCEQLRQKALKLRIPVGEVIQEECKRLSNLISRSSDGLLYETFVYCFRELTRNVIEHSGAPQIIFCAQYWPTKRSAEIAILDRGVGIRDSLSNNPYLSIDDDFEALQLSLKPGISSKCYLGAKIDNEDKWSNSGYGLYVLKRLCDIGGEFAICSGTAAHYQDIKYETFHSGTAVKVVFDFNLIDDDDMIHAIIRQGEDEAERQGHNKRASLSSHTKV